MADEQILYKDLARYYDLIYSWKDYEKESYKIVDLVNKFKKSNGNKLLDVACGTGHHLKYLKKCYSCTGVDYNSGILKVARKEVRGVKFKKSNMIDLDMNKKYDIITCLFSSIGYVKTYSNLKKTIKKFSEHLKQGGVVIIEPWFTPSFYKTKLGKPMMHNY